MLSTNGFLVPLKTFHDALGAVAYKDFREKYRLVEKKQLRDIVHDAIKVVKMDDANYLRLPQSLVQPMKKMMEIQVLFPQIPTREENVPHFTGDLSHCQQLVVDRIMQRFTPERITSGTASMYLNMRAGYGKTFVLIGVIERLNVSYQLRTLVVVPNGEAARQLIDDVEDSFEGLSIGLYNGPTVNAKGGKNTQWDVTVVIINTAVIMPMEQIKQFHMIAIDEAHSYTKSFGKIFEYAFPIRLGMSATPNDSPSSWVGLKSLEPVLDVLTIPDFKYDEVQYDGVAVILEYWAEGSVSHPKNAAGIVDCRAVCSQIIADNSRMDIVARYVMKAVENGNPTFVMAEEVEHLTKFRNHFNALFVDNGVKIGMFVGGISEADSKFCREEADVLLTTHTLCTKAISIPRMTTIVLLTPRKASHIQRIGRIYRRGGPVNKSRCVVDVVDMKTCFRKQLEERMLGYDYYGMKVIRKTKSSQVGFR